MAPLHERACLVKYEVNSRGFSFCLQVGAKKEPFQIRVGLPEGF